MNVTELSADTLDAATRPLRRRGSAAPRMARLNLDRVGPLRERCRRDLRRHDQRERFPGGRESPVEVVRA